MTLTELCKELNNHFQQKIMYGRYNITDGRIDLSNYLLYGQYFRIVGSVFNDGVHKYGDETDVLKDETFCGEIWALAIPNEVIDLCNEIGKWVDKYGDTVNSPFSSESFGGYSYTKSAAGGAEYASVQVTGWQSVFVGKLNRWRKI